LALVDERLAACQGEFMAMISNAIDEVVGLGRQHVSGLVESIDLCKKNITDVVVSDVRGSLRKGVGLVI
jgi:hypothetical protein